MTNSQYNKILSIITTVLVILTGICFIVCCAHLFFTGGSTPYSHASVGRYLKIVATPSALTIVFIIGGLVMKVTSGVKYDETTPRSSSELLESYTKRYDVSTFDAATREKILVERKSRENFKYVSFCFSAAVFTLILAYMIFLAEFTVENLNADVVAALSVALPLSVIGLGIHIPRTLLAEESAKRELALIRSYIKNNGAPKSKAKVNNAKDEIDFAIIARGMLITVALVFILLGVLNGGMEDVLQKAVKICTECIGLG